MKNKSLKIGLLFIISIPSVPALGCCNRAHEDPAAKAPRPADVVSGVDVSLFAKSQVPLFIKNLRLPYSALRSEVLQCCCCDHALATRAGREAMSSLFFIICAVSLVFFTVFLFQCRRPHRKARKQPIVQKVAPAEVVNSAAGRQFMAYLEKEMAEFVVSHSRISALLLATAVLLAIPTAVYGQRTLPPPPPAVDGNQQIPPAVQK